MKTYTYEDLQKFIKQELAQAYNPNLVYCRSINSQNTALEEFLILKEDVRLELPWHDGPQYFSKGDYLHAVPADIYAVSAAIFKNCYRQTNFSHNIAP